MKRQPFLAAAVALLLMFLMSCGSKNQQTASQEAAQSGASAAGQATREGAHHREAKEASAPQVKTYTIPAGTTLHIRLNEAISTATATAGSTFDGTLSSPLTADGVVVVPAGSAVSGQVTGVDRGGRLHHPAALSLTLTALRPTGGESIPITTEAWSAKAQSRTKRNVEMIGGGAGVGALIGALAGKGKGAAIGAAVGAGAGTAGAAFTGQKQIVLPAETPLRFALSQPITITRSNP